jgi:hypothetical protein
LAIAIVFRPAVARVEQLFKVFLAILAVSFLGTALWVGPNPVGILQGVLTPKLPPQEGPFACSWPSE